MSKFFVFLKKNSADTSDGDGYRTQRQISRKREVRRGTPGEHKGTAPGDSIFAKKALESDPRAPTRKLDFKKLISHMKVGAQIPVPNLKLKPVPTDLKFSGTSKLRNISFERESIPDIFNSRKKVSSETRDGSFVDRLGSTKNIAPAKVNFTPFDPINMIKMFEKKYSGTIGDPRDISAMLRHSNGAIVQCQKGGTARHNATYGNRKLMGSRNPWADIKNISNGKSGGLVPEYLNTDRVVSKSKGYWGGVENS
jgi:hypothetical protein